MCYNCHLAAHGKNNNLGLENRNIAGGRPIRHLPEGYENIIDDYLHGRYGYKKCKELLGFTKGMKLTESVEFVQYLEIKGVKDYKNTYDIVFCKKNRVNPVDPNKVVAWIEYESGLMYKMRASGSCETLLPSTKDKI